MLTLTNIRRRFGDVTAVDGVSIAIERGEIFGLLGPNGAGKTTTINMAVGLLEPDDGSVDIAGEGSPTRPEVRRRLGVATQSLAIYDEMTGAENLAFFGRLYAIPRVELSRRVDELLTLTGLTEKASKRVGTYSGGMKRRLNLAAALIHAPDLLLLDEPTAGVDPQSRNAIFEIVQRLRDEGRTILYTTHYMEEAERLCDRVAIIDHGRILACDRTEQLVASLGGRSVITATRAEREESFEVDDPIASAAEIMREGDVTGLQIRRPNLESVFLSLTGRSLRD